MSTLVIVESKGKIEKIKSILGKKYDVVASFGHIMDLPIRKNAVDIDNNFETTYECITDKQKQVVTKLKQEAKGKEVILATDEDREGEMIAWNLANVLKLKKPKRIVFNSITKDELLNAVNNPKDIDMNMVNAQKARRVLDRIAGFDMSEVLRKNLLNAPSAGRVQSVVVRLIVDKEKEIEEFFKKDIGSFFKFTGIFLDKNKVSFVAQMYGDNSEESDIETEDNEDEHKSNKSSVSKIRTEKETKDLLRLMQKSIFTVSEITDKESTRNPSAPFTTSTMQQESSRKLGLSLTMTMQVAQNLYEAGYITYMRTDSTNLSKEAIDNIKKYIVSNFGKQYHRFMQYKSSKNNTQEAHECIRPTDVTIEDIEEKDKIGNNEKRLYRLIWKRAIASQMSPAKFTNRIVKIDISKIKNHYFKTTIQTLLFEGFLKVYNMTNIGNEDNDDTKSIEIKEGKIPMESITAKQDYMKPPSRYNEASLINKLDPKNLNIGRPGTNAKTLENIMNNNYIVEDNAKGIEKKTKIFELKKNDISVTESKVVIGKDMKKLFPTEIGKKVTEFLTNNFEDIMEYKFTSNMEDELDLIAEGKMIWHKMVRKFYDKFHPIVEGLNAKPTVRTDTRVLGKHPLFNVDITASANKAGEFIKMIVDEKPVYIPLMPPYTVENITLKSAIKLFIYPKLLGKYNGENIILFKGQYGLYLTYGEKKINLHDQNEKITIDEAKELIDEKGKDILWEQKDEKNIYTVKNGKFGTYVMIKDINNKNKKPQFLNLNNVVLNTLTINKIKEIDKNIKIYKKNNKDKK